MGFIFGYCVISFAINTKANETYTVSRKKFEKYIWVYSTWISTFTFRITAVLDFFLRLDL
jgi:hypothetical protein